MIISLNVFIKFWFRFEFSFSDFPKDFNLSFLRLFPISTIVLLVVLTITSDGGGLTLMNLVVWLYIFFWLVEAKVLWYYWHDLDYKVIISLWGTFIILQAIF